MKTSETKSRWGLLVVSLLTLAGVILAVAGVFLAITWAMVVGLVGAILFALFLPWMVLAKRRKRIPGT